MAEQRSRPKRKCKRNGAALQAAVNWEIGENMAKTSGASCEAIISTLAVAHPQVLQQDMDAWIASVNDVLLDTASPLEDHSLAAILRRCQGLATGAVHMTFLSVNTFGSKFALLAGGGTLYILLIITGLDLCWSMAKVHGRVIWEVAKLLRVPDDSASGDLVRTNIIPSIHYIKARLPIFLENFCPPQVTQLYKLPAVIDCACLSGSDTFFGSVKFKSPSWENNVLTDVQGSLSTQGSPSATDFNIITITTNYSCDTRFSLSHDKQQNVEWTNQQRELVEQGEDVEDIKDIRLKLQVFYPEGRKVEGAYLRIPMSALSGDSLNLWNADGSLMAFICPSMPDTMRKTLYPKLQGCFNGLNVFKNNTGDPDEDKSECPFSTVLFSWWNHYGLSANGRPINFTQCLPYPDKDVFQYEQLYLNIQTAFQKEFEWIEGVLRRAFPEEYRVLVELVELLPGNVDSPVAPFLSLVLNVDVSTLAHRDDKDLKLCLVLPIGEFAAGGLVLAEQGLVIEAMNGDLLAFCSSGTTHFNLKYLGESVSLVFHADREFLKWKESHNGWADHPSFL
ncbi:hypothetical protein F4604DRAFT_1688598 [Suillus subluteus]|nr:hypothetical protein F4604DRAFT_1688598 [Suillus subluteus]